MIIYKTELELKERFQLRRSGLFVAMIDKYPSSIGAACENMALLRTDR